MNYRRVLLVIDLDAGAGTAIDVIRRVAPDADLLLIVARFPASGIAWLSAQAPADLNAAATESLDALRSAARSAAGSVEIRLEPDVAARDLADLAEAAEIDLLVTRSLPEIAEVRKRRPLSVLWVAEATGGGRPIENVLCVALGERARGAIGRFLRDHATSGLRVTALVNRVSADVASVLQIAGTSARVEQATHPPSTPFDLVVVARLPAAFLAALKWRAPVLVLPPLESSRPALQRGMDVADVVDENGVVRLRAHYALGVGRHEPIPDQTLAIVSGGRVVATVTSEDGAAELAPSPQSDAFGVYRVTERERGIP